MLSPDKIPIIKSESNWRSWKRCVCRFAWRLLVHFEAVRLEPGTYLRAFYARLCGKRLRARLMVAPLFGRTPTAYRLWRSQVRTAAAEIAASGNDDSKTVDSRLVAVVIRGEGETETLESLAREGVEARVIDRACASRFGDNFSRDDSSQIWILPIESGDTLAPGAGRALRKSATAAADSTYIIYADDDLGLEGVPHLKPDWNAELYKHFDFISGAAIIRMTDSDLDDLPLECLDSELLSRALVKTHNEGGTVVHLPYVLYHRRTRPAPCRPAPVEFVASEEAKLPLVTVIVPTRNHVRLLRECLAGLSKTKYLSQIEILVIDNGSDDKATLDYLDQLDPSFARILRYDQPFNFAALNNSAVAEASGELICFLNNDIEINDPDWLSTLAIQAIRDEVGAVGAQLLYPDGRIQHAGVVLGIGGGAANAHRFVDPDDEGYFHRHSLPQFVSAVTAACLVVKRERFLEVGGFDAENFAVSFNDVDLCMKLNERGWQSLYEPRAVLVHHESVSRGFDRDSAGSARVAGELEVLQKRWNTALSPDGHSPDPFHHRWLSPYSEQFVLRI